MNGLVILLCVVVSLLLLWLVPLWFIWAVNTLFGLEIVATFVNWFAALSILILVGGSRS